MSVALVACGDSGPTREEYIAKADAFCKERNAEAKERNEKLQQIATEAHSEEEFKDIEAPDADQETIDKLVAATDDEIAVLEKVVEAAKARDFERFGDLINDQQNIDERANEIAQDYGLKECGSEASEADSS